MPDTSSPEWTERAMKEIEKDLRKKGLDIRSLHKTELESLLLTKAAQQRSTYRGMMAVRWRSKKAREEDQKEGRLPTNWHDWTKCPSREGYMPSSKRRGHPSEDSLICTCDDWDRAKEVARSKRQGEPTTKHNWGPAKWKKDAAKMKPASTRAAQVRNKRLKKKNEEKAKNRAKIELLGIACTGLCKTIDMSCGFPVYAPYEQDNSKPHQAGLQTIGQDLVMGVSQERRGHLGTEREALLPCIKTQPGDPGHHLPQMR